MTRQEIQDLLVDDPQKLIDDEVRFSFNEVVGTVVTVDGVAAGGAWEAFKFLDGPFAGKVLYCQADDIWEHDQVASFEYSAHCCDDGMLFNKDPERFNPDKDEDWGGDYVPELDGRVFTIKGE